MLLINAKIKLLNQIILQIILYGKQHFYAHWTLFPLLTPLTNKRNSGDVDSAVCNTSFCHMGTLGVQLKLVWWKASRILLRKRLGSWLKRRHRNICYHAAREKAAKPFHFLLFCYEAKSEWLRQCHFPRLCSEELQQLSNQRLPGDLCLNSSWKATRPNVAKSFIRPAVTGCAGVCVRATDWVTGEFQPPLSPSPTTLHCSTSRLCLRLASGTACRGS